MPKRVKQAYAFKRNISVKSFCGADCEKVKSVLREKGIYLEEIGKEAAPSIGSLKC